MSIFDRFSDLRGILSLLRNIEIEHLTKVFEAISVLTDEKTELLDQVRAALVIADVVTDYIPGELDDQAVDAIASLLEHDQLEDVLALVEQLFASQHVEDARMIFASKPEGLQLSEDSKAIPWPVVIQIASAVISLIRMLREDK